MKILLTILMVLSLGCTENSSPEGRMKMKSADLQKQIDELKMQQIAILDSLQAINQNLKSLKTGNKF